MCTRKTRSCHIWGNTHHGDEKLIDWGESVLVKNASQLRCSCYTSHTSEERQILRGDWSLSIGMFDKFKLQHSLCSSLWGCWDNLCKLREEIFSGHLLILDCRCVGRACWCAERVGSHGWRTVQGTRCTLAIVLICVWKRSVRDFQVCQRIFYAYLMFGVG